VTDGMSKQLSLFGGEEPPPAKSRRAPLEAAPQDEETCRLGGTLPPEVRLGTSSWTFPGWKGLVYEGGVSKPRLAAEGLAAYARHPVFATVGVDRTYYTPVREELYREWAEAVPGHFRFLVKAHEWTTLPRFADHARYGARRGRENELFLDADYLQRSMIEPMLAGLGEKAGPLVLQFSPLRLGGEQGRRRFLDRLHAFLRVLPQTAKIAVEIRNRELLGRDYAEVLADAGVSHCFNVHATMPGVARQREFFGKQPVSVVRWMLGHGQRYQDAAERYQPFDRLVDEDPESRGEIADLIAESVGRNVPVYVTVNNKAEGSSPLSVVKLAAEIQRRLDPAMHAGGEGGQRRPQ
jgi:uncharacterized protein YecE (DUF72 family)